VACPFSRLVFTPYPLLSTPICMTRTLPGFGERSLLISDLSALSGSYGLRDYGP
jgi:hypothetical protein